MGSLQEVEHSYGRWDTYSAHSARNGCTKEIVKKIIIKHYMYKYHITVFNVVENFSLGALLQAIKVRHFGSHIT